MSNQIEQLLEKLTLEEKIAMIHGSGLFQTGGVERLGIPPLKMSDGPMGVRKEFYNDSWKPIGNSDDYVTYLPSNGALAATWNRELAYQFGEVLGEEARGRGKDVILAPGINIKRSPLCGRNFEYMSEDPYLISEMVVALIRGIQQSDVAACVKHFAANNQETNRHTVDVQLEERAFREIYLPGFYAAIKRGEAYSIMGAYNKLRGEQCCHSKGLLNGILRDEWQYDGVIISDWGGVHDTIEAAESALDIEMSVTRNFDQYYMAQPLLKAIQDGEIDVQLIDDKVRRILQMMQKLNMLGGQRKAGCYNTSEHRQIALEVAREAIVLLKNDENRLPLQPDKLNKLLVIGDNAERLHSNGGGSAEIKALYEISPLMGLKSKLGGNTEVLYARGYYAPENNNKHNGQVEGDANKLNEQQRLAEIETLQTTMRSEAVKLAAQVEQVVLFIGLNHDYDVEGKDREDMLLPYRQDELIEQVLEANPGTVIVITAGSPVDMNRWIHKAKAVIWNGYNGMEGGNALAEVLLGIYNPSGRLPETFPYRLEDCCAHSIGEFPGNQKVYYDEGVFVGYRHYDTHHIKPQFCFGHGLSYTTFEYGALEVAVDEHKIVISCQITNSGEIEGDEVVQLYVSDLNYRNLGKPEQELKGYEKVGLKPNESKRVTLTIERSELYYFDSKIEACTVSDGAYEIRIASSSRDIKGRAVIDIAY